MSHRGIRALVGLATVAVIAGIVAVAVGLFRGSFTEAVPVTVVSRRAGLVMNPDAKVKMRGVQVGKVASIESRPNGQAALHLAMDPSQLGLIPANVLVDITSTTVFGAKFVEPRLVHGSTVEGSDHASTSQQFTKFHATVLAGGAFRNVDPTGKI